LSQPIHTVGADLFAGDTRGKGDFSRHFRGLNCGAAERTGENDKKAKETDQSGEGNDHRVIKAYSAD
jgi:hypothetical protein